MRVTIFRWLIVDIGFYHKVVLVQRDALMKFLLNDLPDISVDFLLLTLNVEILRLFQFGILFGFTLIVVCNRIIHHHQYRHRLLATKPSFNQKLVLFFYLSWFHMVTRPPAVMYLASKKLLSSPIMTTHLLQLMMIWLVILTRREEMRTELLK